MRTTLHLPCSETAKLVPLREPTTPPTRALVAEPATREPAPRLATAARRLVGFAIG